MTDDLPDTVDRIDHERTAPTGPAVSDRYASILLEDDAAIVYDRARTDAWIQSDIAVPLPGERPPKPVGDADDTTAGTDLPDVRRE